MHRESFILLSVTLEVLVLATLHASVNALLGIVLGKIVTLDYKEVLFVIDDHAVKISEAAMAKRHEVYGIEQVRLPHPITSDKTIQLLG